MILKFLKKIYNYFKHQNENKSSKKWGELDHIIIERTPVKLKFKYKGEGWDLVINNYTKCDVLEHDTWNCTCYEGDNDYCYITSQVSSDIYFLWWRVATIHSMVSVMKVSKEWMNDKNAMNYIYDFTNHGSINSIPNIHDFSRQYRNLGGYQAYIGQSPCEIGYDYLIFDDYTQNYFHDAPLIYINFED